MPEKRSKKKPLPASGKEKNRAISSERVALRERHRNAQALQDHRRPLPKRRRRSGLRFFLTAALCNMEPKAT